MLGYNLLFIVCFFPVWLIKFKFQSIDYIYIGIFFLLLMCLNHLIIKRIKDKKNIFYIYIASILTFGIDNSLSLHNDVVLPNKDLFLTIFHNVYLFSLFLVILIFCTIFIISKKLQSKGIIIVSSFITVIFAFSMIDGSKSYKNLNEFDKNDKILNFEKSKIVFLLDEMGGLGSFESNTELGKEFDLIAKNFAKKYAFNIYSNIYSTFPQSIRSISKILNNDMSDKINESDYSELSDSFYTEYNITKNKLFDNFDSIAVYEGMHINYCENKKVNKCRQFNQFSQTGYIKGFKDTTLTRLINGWKLYGSSIGSISWRTFIQFELIDGLEKSSGEKAAFLSLLTKVEKDIKSKKFDLIFVHSMVTHKPFGLDQNCNYSGKLAMGSFSLISEKEKVKRHNLDRICTIKFLDQFFKKLKDQKIFDNVEIYILSDHGSRIKQNDINSTLKNIFLFKNINTKYEVIKEKSFIQDIFFKKVLLKN